MTKSLKVLHVLTVHVMLPAEFTKTQAEFLVKTGIKRVLPNNRLKVQHDLLSDQRRR